MSQGAPEPSATSALWSETPIASTVPAKIPSLRWWIAGGLFLLTFLLYLSSLAPSVVTLFDDSLEFQLVTYQLGIAHPTGYPLYTLLGKLFTFLPVGNVAFRVNLMSAIFGAGTVVLVYLFILRLIAPLKMPPRSLPATGGCTILC